MPIYEYKCESCGKAFTKIQKFADEPLTVHEECGGGPVERLISTPAFHFKGTGWYATDYAKTGSGNPGSKSEGESKSKDESKPATETRSTTESTSASTPAATPAAKSESKPQSPANQS